ncbi:MAG: DUF3084 domain-containing protein [Firmicutes bacterium]|nr:DUF3084 domain-containing protein [Bacillota bacterium]
MFRLIIIFLVLALMGGSIAYLGNQLGRYIGRRKLSIFNLRPRHTSILITIFTGILIALLTMGIAAIMSKDVRQFLKGIESLRQQRDKLLEEIDIATKTVRIGDIIFLIHDPIVAGVIPGGLSKDVIKEKLNDILAQANLITIEKSNNRLLALKKPFLGQDEKLILYNNENYDQTVEQLLKSKEDQVVYVIAHQNVFLREKVPVIFQSSPNMLVFRRGEVITSVTVDGRKSRDAIFNELYGLMKSKVRTAALKKGIIQDFVTGEIRSELKMSDIVDTAWRISQMRRSVKVEVEAKKDIYSIDPLDIELVLVPMG